MKTILILATLDTKYEEARILGGYIRDHGCTELLLDCSLRMRKAEDINVLRQEMMEQNHMKEEDLEKLEKNDALLAMTEMVRSKIWQMHKEQRLDGVVGIGGVQGTLISTGAMQVLPVGVPKFVLSAVANGNTAFGPLVGMSDMVIMHSVVDVAGNNSILRQLMNNAAAAVCAMAEGNDIYRSKGASMIGITMGGVTTKCGNYIKEILEKYGFEVVIFHCNGIGAMAMEKLAEEGRLSAVIDLTPHDVTDRLYGGMMPAAGNRYEVFERVSLPVIIVPGCADIILFNGTENVPEAFRGRKLVEHNKIHTHVKADYREMYEVGRFIADKAGRFRGEVRVLIPQKGYSQKNCPGGPLYEPESDCGFVDALMGNRGQRVAVEPVSAHINDREFAGLCAEEIIDMLERKGENVG